MTLGSTQGWLEGRVVLVTGGASGIGLAITERFVLEGAKVGIMDRDAERVRAAEAAHPGSVAGYVGDVRDPADNASAVERTVAAFGRLDTFIGNAGVYDFNRPIESYAPDMLAAGFDEIFAINVKGYLLGVAAALPELRKSEDANIVLTISNSGLYAGGGGPLYVASKHAVVGLVRQLAYELAPDIRVNGVAPGGTITRLAGLEALGKGGLHMDAVEGAGDYIAAGLPLGFVPDAQDHAGAYVLLASGGNARAITGAVLPSDGGLEVRGKPRRRR